MNYREEFEDNVLRTAENLFEIIGNSCRANRASKRLSFEEIQESLKLLEVKHEQYKDFIKKWDWCHETCYTSQATRAKLVKCKDATRRATIKELKRLNPDLITPTLV